MLNQWQKPFMTSECLVNAGDLEILLQPLEEAA